MRKLIATSLLLTMLCGGMQAQDNTIDPRDAELRALREEVNQLKKNQEAVEQQNEYNQRQEAIWKKSTPWLITYGSQTLEDEALGVKYKSDFSFSTSKRRTYDLHHKAIGGMLKFGIDMTWLDISFTRYEKGKKL